MFESLTNLNSYIFGGPVSISSRVMADLYRKLILVRLCEEKIREDYFQDNMKTPVHLGIGGEAIAIGVQGALPPKSKVFGTYRNHAIYLALSNDTDGFWAELYGKVTGCGKGKAGSMHMSCPEHGLIATSAVVGTTIPVAVGSAMATVYQGGTEPSVVFLGDGSVEEGVFYESLNFAALKKLPVLFVIEDNDLAIHAKREDREGFKSFESLAGAFEVEFMNVDGTDIKKVFEAAQDMLKRMSENKRPGVMHCEYFRFLEHVGPSEDFKFGYRVKPANIDIQFDPVVKAERELALLGVGQTEIDAMKKSVVSQIEGSIEAAKRAPFPGDHELFTDVYA